MRHRCNSKVTITCSWHRATPCNLPKGGQLHTWSCKHGSCREARHRAWPPALGAPERLPTLTPVSNGARSRVSPEGILLHHYSSVVLLT